MATWQGALIRAVTTDRLLELAERYRIVVSDPSGPWVLINVDPQYGRLGPPPFAQGLSKDLNTSVIAFFLQTTVSNERVEHWENGELVRELEYYQDGGGWIAQGGTPQAWEGDYFFSDDEGTGDTENWPRNLSDEVSTEDVARYEEARSKHTPGPIMDLLMGGSITRLCRFCGVDPKRPSGYYKSPPNWRVTGTLIAVALFFVSACILGYVYR
jgi:hypothetical protein